MNAQMVASVPGAVSSGRYHDTPASIAGDRGSDFVTLMLVVPSPALVVAGEPSEFLVARHRSRWPADT